MTTKKQREELKTALSGWVFEGIAHDWSTTDILLQVHRDWQDIVGDASGVRGARELSEWQGKVLDLLAVGTQSEVAKKQREADASLLLWATTEFPEGSIAASFVRHLAEELVAGTAVKRGVGTDTGEIAVFKNNPSSSLVLEG